jgi:cytochrome c2
MVAGMNLPRKAVCMALVLTAVIDAAAADAPVPPGQRVFERRCQTCHGATGPAALPIGPSLAGIVGRRAGKHASGVHSRAVLDSGIVWSRESLRRFVSDPEREIPLGLMSSAQGVANPAELEALLDYLESLREVK